MKKIRLYFIKIMFFWYNKYGGKEIEEITKKAAWEAE